MNKKPALVIMAAGMGSRFGGLKQITAVDEEKNSIMDFSMYDAWRAGFRRVVFIISRSIEESFKEAVGKRMEAYFDVHYVYQEVSCLPAGYEVPEGRKKPWGTGQAVLCAAEAVDGPFAVINADDYYGPGAFKKVYDFLCQDQEPGHHAMAGYLTRNTLTENGWVSRGVCDVREGYLTGITERTKIEKRGRDAAFTEDDGKTFTELSGDTLVSMNLWAFQPDILEEYRKDFSAFLDRSLEADPLKCEYYITSPVHRLIQEGHASVRVLPVDDVWHGITYSQDLPELVEAIKDLKARGVYPEKLWMEPSAMYHFQLEGAPFSAEPFGSGHINRTFLVTSTTGRRYILQRISEAFNIPGMMENIVAVTQHIAAKAADPREGMRLVMTDGGDSFYKDESGSYRVYDFVEEAYCLQNAEKPEDFYEAARVFGRFEELLEDFPADTLCESIVNFHNTPDRYRQFKETVAKNASGRADQVRKEIDFCLVREEKAGLLQRLRDQGELPVRVTHNDTKLNNVMFDNKTHRGLCAVDLDTVMPGLSLYDYGDAIRYGASTAAEDERDLSLVHFDRELFRMFTRGFLETCRLSEKEISLMREGSLIMTLECGMRFLADHIDGDHYFSIHREGQNLDRARTQFKLVKEMEELWDEMEKIIREEQAAAEKNIHANGI